MAKRSVVFQILLRKDAVMNNNGSNFQLGLPLASIKSVRLINISYTGQQNHDVLRIESDEFLNNFGPQRYITFLRNPTNNLNLAFNDEYTFNVPQSNMAHFRLVDIDNNEPDTFQCVLSFCADFLDK